MPIAPAATPKNNMTNSMEKKTYQQPTMKNMYPWVTMPVAQMNIGSQENEEQWSKQRDDHESEPQYGSDYGNLW